MRDVSLPEEARARAGDPETSVAAAAAISRERIRRVRDAVLGLFEGRVPMTDETLVGLYRRTEGLPHASDSRIRTARHELASEGLLVSFGRQRNTRGFACFTWGSPSWTRR